MDHRALYRVLLLAVIAVIGACAAYLLARPAPEPAGDAASVPEVEDSPVPVGR
jgi:hypothetical protein